MYEADSFLRVHHDRGILHPVLDHLGKKPTWSYLFSNILEVPAQAAKKKKGRGRVTRLLSLSILLPQMEALIGLLGLVKCHVT